MLGSLVSSLSIVFLAALTPQELSRQASPAVFRLETVSADGSMGSGTGFLINENGLMVTNHHVVAGARSVVAEQGALRIPVRGFYGFDAVRDLALIQLDDSALPKGTVPHVALAPDSKKAEPGLEVMVIGHPQAVKVANQTVGRITAVESDTERLRFDAGIMRGSSGSPLFDLETGLVLGVVTSIYTGGQSFNYATPVDHLLPHVRAVEGGAVIRPFSAYTHASTSSLGVTTSDPRLRNLIVSLIVLAGFFVFFRWVTRARG